MTQIGRRKSPTNHKGENMRESVKRKFILRESVKTRKQVEESASPYEEESTSSRVIGGLLIGIISYLAAIAWMAM